MAFVNISLLLGGLFMAVPIVVHLAMRRQPRRQVFPALRFLKQRREANQRRLRIRHWLLLALRCGLIALLAAALARPSVGAPRFGTWMLGGVMAALWIVVVAILTIVIFQGRGRLLIGLLAVAAVLTGLMTVGFVTAALGGGTTLVLGNERAPVAAVLIIDTSPRMEYRHENQTRLAVAREMAGWLLAQLPSGSEVGVLDARPGPAHFSIDLAAAVKSVQRLRTSALAEPVAVTVARGIRLLETSNLDRKEIFVFTDLTAASWPRDSAASLRRDFEAVANVSLYVVDVGVEQMRNTSLGDLRLSAETVARQNAVRISTRLASGVPAEARIVDIFVEEPDPERPLVVDGETLVPRSLRRDHIVAELTDTKSRIIEFELRGLSPGVHQGSIRIRGSDALPIDDVRYFAVEIRDAWPILVVAASDVEADFFIEAIAPHEFVRAGQAAYECTVIDPSELKIRDLSEYAAVALLDPRPLDQATWERLTRFVVDGGGLAVFLGHHAKPLEEFNQEAVGKLLGGRLVMEMRAGGRDLYLAPSRYDHPILSPFRRQSTSVPWDESPVFRYWLLDDFSQATNVILAYGNNKPALLETRHGGGRVLTMTTPISDPLTPRGRVPWNELPTSQNAWPYLVLVNESMKYLVDGGDSRLNYLAGEPASLSNDPERDPVRYRLFPPGEMPFEIAAHRGEVNVRFTERAGAYRLKGVLGGPVTRGFAVNVAARQTDLARIDSERLAEFFGEDRYSYARRRDEILSDVGQSRVGREFYPYLLTVLVFVLGLEHLLANRFYRESA